MKNPSFMVDFQIFPLELPSIGDFPLPRLITIGLWCPFANMILGYMGAPLQSHAKSSIWHGHHGHWKSEVSHENMALSENGGTPKISKHPLVHQRKIPIETAMFVSKNSLRHRHWWHNLGVPNDFRTILGWTSLPYGSTGSLSFDWAAMTRL